MNKPEDEEISSKYEDDLTELELLSDNNFLAYELTSELSPPRAMTGICFQNRFEVHLW